ncbi:SpoIIAA-like protein [Dokdonia sp. Hel_I_53]|nr:SpoIIAA-like protein [Dokdonia sp. Hel_I_53]
MVVTLNISERVIGFVFEKKLDQEGVDEIKESILEKLEKYESINLYLEEDDTEDVNLKALMEEMLFNINHSNRFERVAVVTDRDWIRNLSTFKGVLMDSELKTFTLGERVDALSWIIQSSNLRVSKKT